MLYRGQRPGWNDAGDPLVRCALPKVIWAALIVI